MRNSGRVPAARRTIANTGPDPGLRISGKPEDLGLEELRREFYRRDTVSVARSLVGAFFARRFRGAWYVARIVETEAYLGERDDAAHSRGGRRTARVEPMYADGGHLYVFFVYGMHHCANLVTRGPGKPEAVLIRAGEGPDGSSPSLLSGPGRFCSALAITTAASGLDVVAGADFRILRRPRRPRIGVSPRIGVDYAETARNWLLRFYDRDSRAVSGRRVS